MTNPPVHTRFMLALAALPLLLGAGTPGDLQVDLSGVRNTKGTLRLCLSASEKNFPDCGKDPAARMVSVPARQTGVLFSGVPAGDYALSVMHDENGNARLDTAMGIPREGFGFSRNPAVRFGPPKFRDVRFAMPAGPLTMPVKMKYFL